MSLRQLKSSTLSETELDAYCKSIHQAIDEFNNSCSSSDVSVISQAINKIIESINKNSELPNQVFSHQIFLSNLIKILETLDITLCPLVALLLSKIIYFTS